MPRASAKTWPTHHRDPRAHGLVRLVHGGRNTRGTDRIAKRSAPLQYLTVGRLTEMLRLRALRRQRCGVVLDIAAGKTISYVHEDYRLLQGPDRPAGRVPADGPC